MSDLENLLNYIKSFEGKITLPVVISLTVAILSWAYKQIATIVTLTGITLPRIISYFKKDWSIIKYKILKRSWYLELNNESNNKSLKKYIRTAAEISKACWIVIAPLITIYFVSPWVSSAESDTKRAYAYALACLFSFIAAVLFYKIRKVKRDKDENKKYFRFIEKNFYVFFLVKAFCCILVNCIGLLIILNFISSDNAYGIYFTVTVMSVLNFILSQMSFTIIDASKEVIIISILKVILGTFIIVYILFKTADEQIITSNIRNLFFIIWTMMCGAEYIINDITRNKYLQYIEYNVYMTEKIVNTRSSIYQYKCDKVKWTLNDGNIEIVDNEVINYIKYTLKTYFPIKRKKVKSNVTCSLKNKIEMEFDDYKYIKDSWVAFYKIDEEKNEKQVEVFHLDKIKKIDITYVSESS